MGRGHVGDFGSEKGTLEAQPYWARQLLVKKKEETVEQEEARPGIQLTGTVGNRLDLLCLVHQGNGGGLVVDTALADMYPACRKDIANLVLEGSVRQVLRRGEGGGPFRRMPDADPRNQHPAMHRFRAAGVAVGGVPWQDLLERAERHLRQKGFEGIAFEDFVALARSHGRLSSQLVSDEDLSTVFRLVAADLSSRVSMKELVALVEDDKEAPFPQNLALFPRFEQEAEAARVDQDIVDAFHAVPPVSAGDSGAKVAPKQQAAAPKQPVRRTSYRKRKLQNTHMFGDEPL